MKWGLWSTTAGSNSATPPDGWPEGQLPSTVNDCAREMMASIRTGISDIQFIDLAHSPTFQTANTLTLPGNLASTYHVGRRVKVFDATTLYGTIYSSTGTSSTALGIRFDSGAMTGSLSSIAIGAIAASNPSLPDNTYLVRNWAMNGRMNVWQRALSGTAASTGVVGYGADRYAVFANGGVVNISRSERSETSTNVPSLPQAGAVINQSMLLAVTAIQSLSANALLLLSHVIEGYDWAEIGHKPLTVSFWVNSNRTGTYCLSMRNAGTDQAFIQEYQISAASTWERKVIAFPEAPTSGTWNYSTGIGVNMTWVLNAGSTFRASAGVWTAANVLATANQINWGASAGNAIRFTDIRIVPGIGDIPVPIRRYQEELADCQRYFQVVRDSGGTNFVGRSEVLGQSFYCLDLPVDMRVTPSLSFDAIANYSIAAPGGGGGTLSAIFQSVPGTTNKIEFTAVQGFSGGTATVAPAASVGFGMSAGSRIMIGAEFQ